MSDIKQALPTYGRDLIPTLDRALFDDCLVFCAPEAWELVKHEFLFPPKQVAVPKAMELKKLDRQVSRLAQCETVFGVGGGSACDAAKYFAATTGATLVLAPSILSVDAPFTKAVGIRVDNRVRYVHEVFPQHLLIDFNLLEQAPARLNRAGVADILSIFTALWDWRLAAETHGESFDADIAAQSQQLLDTLLANAGAIAANTEAGLRVLAELFVGEVALCERHGTSRPEEGSEHYLAYCCEALTGRHFIHGELVALGVLLAGMHQEQPLEPVVEFLREVGLDFSPSHVGVSVAELKQTLLRVSHYVNEEPQLLPGVFHHHPVSEQRADHLLARLADLVG